MSSKHDEESESDTTCDQNVSNPEDCISVSDQQQLQDNNENNDKKADYVLDGIYFENIEKIGAFPAITNLKKAIK